MLGSCAARTVRRACPDQSPIALQALEKIGALFAIERGINGQSAEIRRTVRQAQSVPLLADLKTYLETSLTRISGKSDLAKAIRYSLNRWEGLWRFTEDGRLEMSNNAAERAIRPLTLGRRNWTFLGSDSGGERAAIVFTLIQSCKLNGVNPEAYLADLVGRVGDHPASRLDALLPWNWSSPGRLKLRPMSKSIAVLKITLDHVEPKVTRRIVVPSDIRLY